MGKKNFDVLVSNMIGESSTSKISTESRTTTEHNDTNSSNAAVGSSSQRKSYTTNFCGRADFMKLEKLRAISEKENVSIKDIYNTAFSLFISAYEKKHGTVKTKSKPAKGDISKIL